MARSTVYRVAERFRKWEDVGLLDGREDNGQAKLDERYLATLYRLVKSNPQVHGWRRSTWTREMLVETTPKKTGVRILLESDYSCSASRLQRQPAPPPSHF